MKEKKGSGLSLPAAIFAFLAGAVFGVFVSVAFREASWNNLLYPLAVYPLAFGLLGLLFWSRRRTRGDRTAGLLASLPYAGLLLPVFFLPDYLVGEGPSHAVSITLLCLSLACFLSLRLLLFSPRASRFEDWISTKSLRIALSTSIIFMVFVVACGVTKYVNFGFPGTDLGCFMQSFWTALHGHLFLNSYELAPAFGSHLGKHFSAIMFLMVPLFALFPHCTTFFVLSAAGLGLGSIVVFLLAREKLGKYCGLCFSIGYLLYPGISYQAWFPYYFIHFAPLFLLLALYYFHRGRIGPFCLFLILACSVREEITLTVFMFGIYAIVRRKGISWILFPFILGGGWFFLAMKLIIPVLGPGTIWEFYEDTGGSLDAVLQSIFCNPALVLRRFLAPDYLKLLYLILMPLGVALPFLGPEIIFVLPTMVILALSSKDQTRVIYGYYYLPLVPFVFAAAITAVGRLSAWGYPAFLTVRDRSKLLCTFILFLALAVFARGPLSETMDHGLTRPFNASSGPGDSETLRRVVGMVPPEAGVFSPRYMMPHLAKRMYIVPHTPFEAEYLIIDTRTADAWTAEFQKDIFIQSLDENPDYVRLFDENGVKLYRRFFREGGRIRPPYLPAYRQ